MKPRFQGLAAPQGKAGPVRSYLAVPVISRSNEVIGGLFFGHAQPGVFTHQSEQVVEGLAQDLGRSAKRLLQDEQNVLLDAAPDLDVCFKDEADREAARNFMDLLDAAGRE